MNECDIDSLAVGMRAELAKTITDADIVLFAGVSCDTNAMHLDQAYAEGTAFGGRIAHGMLTASLISAVIGTRLPGPGAIYLSQTLRFVAPVKPGDTVTATVTVKEVMTDRRRANLTTVCSVGGKPVIEGEALVLVPTASRASPRKTESQ